MPTVSGGSRDWGPTGHRDGSAVGNVSNVVSTLCSQRFVSSSILITQSKSYDVIRSVDVGYAQFVECLA